MNVISAVWINLIGLVTLISICCYGGAVIFAKYHDCDPLTAGVILFLPLNVFYDIHFELSDHQKSRSAVPFLRVGHHAWNRWRSRIFRGRNLQWSIKVTDKFPN